jgi:hypothetical protein
LGHGGEEYDSTASHAPNLIVLNLELRC